MGRLEDYGTDCEGNIQNCVTTVNTAGTSISWELPNIYGSLENILKIPIASESADKLMIRSEICVATKYIRKPDPTKIIRNGPVTVIFWDDGTKTLVRRNENSEDDPYLAFCAALAKKVFGNNTRVKKLIEEKTVKPKERKKEEQDHD